MNSIPELCFQIADLSDAGKTLSGSVACNRLELDEDGRLEFPGDLRFTLHFAPVQQGLLVRGELETLARMPCDRCLCEVDVPVVLTDVYYHFETLPLGQLDLTEAVREDILLALPQSCLCRDECRGLCPSCGRNLNQGTCSCAAQTDAESPWGALDDLNLP